MPTGTSCPKRIYSNCNQSTLKYWKTNHDSTASSMNFNNVSLPLSWLAFKLYGCWLKYTTAALVCQSWPFVDLYGRCREYRQTLSQTINSYANCNELSLYTRNSLDHHELEIGGQYAGQKRIYDKKEFGTLTSCCSTVFIHVSGPR